MLVGLNLTYSNIPSLIAAALWDAILLRQVNHVVSTLAPLATARVAATLRKGIAELFSSYTGAVGAAFARHRGADGRLPDLLGVLVTPAPCLIVNERNVTPDMLDAG